MHRVTALTRGPMTPAPHDGRAAGFVHSVFERICNIKLNDGAFLALCRDNLSNGPGVIRCHTGAAFSFETTVHIDEEVAVRGGVLRIGRSLQVDLRRAACIERQIPFYDLEAFHTHVESHLTILQSHPANDRVEALIDPSGISFNDLISLAGRGPGLTPAGDDFLVGVAAGLASSERLSEDFQTSLREAALRTTELSGRSLIYAAEASFIDPVLDYIDALQTPVDRGSPPRLLTIGDTSGAAMAHGILRGLAEAIPSSKIGLKDTPNHQEAA